jgi:hypothetical protein
MLRVASALVPRLCGTGALVSTWASNLQAFASSKCDMSAKDSVLSDTPNERAHQQ